MIRFWWSSEYVTLELWLGNLWLRLDGGRICDTRFVGGGKS